MLFVDAAIVNRKLSVEKTPFLSRRSDGQDILLQISPFLKRAFLY